MRVLCVEIEMIFKLFVRGVIMFYFINFDTPTKSENYDKGVLFERLCKDLLDASGYNDIEMRVKANNLEYDIVANNKVTNQKLIGEAKAWDKKISSEIMAFIAKMMHFWIKEPNDWGIFISISDLTSDVKQQVDDLVDAGYHIRYIVGDSIIDALVSQKNYLSVKQIRDISQNNINLCSGDVYFLVSDRGYYYIQLLIEDGKTLPSYFVCYDMFGNSIEDEDFILRVSSKIELLKELKYYKHGEKTKYSESEVDNSYLGVMHGEGWFDYQFPANPDRFIGRTSLINAFNDSVNDVKNGITSTKVIEILSRSGVGKSSISLKLQRLYKEKGFSTAIVDSRNIRSDIDILQIFQMLVKDFNFHCNLNWEVPKEKEQINIISKSIDEFNTENGKMSLIFLDQFESVFARPSVYNTLIDIILEFNVKFKSFIFVIARKNDQPTTYDESSLIDLNRLKSISKPIVLQDFKTEEAIELISHINDEIGTSLIKPLKEQVLEISNGFPWLLKKYCAHIIKLVRSGEKQKNIVQSGMQLEDLFNEDILALDEAIREFFYRLIAYLPSTYAELSEIFTDEDLSIKLKILQNDYRLIRLTGRTYDTYNDILKEFVKTGHVNLSRRYLIRYTPNTVLNLYKIIVSKNLCNVDQIVENSRVKKTSIINILGELKKLKFIEGSNNNFSLNPYAYQYYTENNIVKYLANILMDNTLIKKILLELEKNKKLTLKQVKNILISEMPFIDATDKIWEQYSKVMCKWLSAATMVNMDKNNTISTNNLGREIGDFLSDEIFFPTTMLAQIIKVVELLADNKEGMTIQELKKSMKRSSLNGHLIDACFLGLVRPISRSEYEITQNGLEFLGKEPNEKRAYIREKLLGLEYVCQYLEQIKTTNKEPLEVFTNILDEMKVDKWNEVSIKWKHKLLRNWLIYSKLVVGKTHKKQVD